MTTAQLEQAGVNHNEIARLVERGWLTRVRRGVYAIGEPREGTRVLAAVLATGGVASHVDAAALWDLLPPGIGDIHITVPTRNGREQRGVILHRAQLTAGERTTRYGIPCTSLLRTLLDLAAIADLATLARAFDQAQVLHHLQPVLLGAAVRTRRGRRGARKLDALLAYAVDPGEIESLLELHFVRFCRDHGLPQPETQVPFGPYHADFLFRAWSLVIETDSRWHDTAARRARDARKTAHLEARGLTVLRLRWADLRADPAALAARIYSSATARGGPVSSTHTAPPGR